MEKILTASSQPIVRTDWPQALPVLSAGRVVLRELRREDATSLCALLSTEEVARFISPPPTTVDGFERFFQFVHAQRAAGEHVCFAVTLEGFETAIGIFQVRRLDTSFQLAEWGFATAEWGFAIGSAFWGTGVFRTGAELMMHLAFDVIGVHRLEARACLTNSRGNAALRKIGAVQECILHRALLRDGVWLDQAMYAILDGDHVARKTRRLTAPRLH